MALHEPFALYIMPHADKPEFISDSAEGRDDGRTFTVSSWFGLPSNDYTIGNGSDCRPASVQDKIWKISTDRYSYIRDVDDLIDRLRDHGGKTVMSRVIGGDASGIDWIRVAELYFARHPEAFRYLYFTPRHGFWLGASPELLLKSDGSTFSTMALAGTRKVADQSMPWSGKNIAEQAIVRDYIVNRLYDLGLKPVVGKTETVTTGNIQHLRTLISGKLDDVDPLEILNTLNPTPALAGYPIDQALENIVEFERHPRKCYGAYMAINDNGNFSAYVNLRCVNFDPSAYCMYVGGGIMPDSDSAEEWDETEAKGLILKQIIEDSRS